MNEKLIILNLLHNQNLIEPLENELEVIKKFIGIQAQINNNAMYAIAIRNKKKQTKITNEQVYKVWSIRGTVHDHLSSETDLITQLFKEENCIKWDKYMYRFLDARSRKQMEDITLEIIKKGISNRQDITQESIKMGVSKDRAEFAYNSYGGTLKDLVYNGKIRFSSFDSGDFIENFQENYAEEKLIEFSKSMTLRYFDAYGPATFSDFLHWTGVKSAQAKIWFNQVKDQLQSFPFGKKTYFHVKELKTNLNEMPECLFLTGFDPFMLAHKEKSMWLNDEHRPLIRTVAFFKNIILINGHCVGTWKTSKNILEITLFTEVDSKTIDTIISYSTSNKLLEFKDYKIMIANKEDKNA